MGLVYRQLYVAVCDVCLCVKLCVLLGLYKAMGSSVFMITVVLGWVCLCGCAPVCISCCGCVAKSMCVIVYICMCIHRFLVVHMHSYGYVYICVAVYMCTAMPVW